MDKDAIIKYFGLNEHPFITTPDPRFLYFSSQVKEALAKCEFMARDRIGPIYMYGPIGSGKTSLVRRLQEKLSQDERYNVKLLISPNLKSSNAFLRLILETFDVKTERSYTASLANFEKYLIQQYQDEKVPVLLIDEAQNMTRDTLKLIQYLLNYETNKTKLLQIVLVGQQELGTKIMQFRELASRMFPIAMNAMSPDDLKDMISFRLTVAGYTGALFEDSDEAYKTLYTYTKGLPRDAIKVCFELLIELIALGKKQATAKHVEEIAKGQNLRIYSMGRFDALTQLDKKADKTTSAVEKPANPQTVLPETQQVPLPANLQDGKPAKQIVGKPTNQQNRIPAHEVVEKYTTRLKPSLIKEIKVFAAQHDSTDYEIVQQAVKEYLAKRK